MTARVRKKGRNSEEIECVGVFQGMDDEVAVLAVVIQRCGCLDSMRELLTKQTTIGDDSVGG